MTRIGTRQPHARLRTADTDADTDPFDAAVAAVSFVTRRDPNPGWRLDRHANQTHHILAFAASGRAHYTCDDKSFTVSEGDVLFFPRGTPHSAHSDPRRPWSFYSTAFDLRCTAEVEARLAGLPPAVAASNRQELLAMFRQLQQHWVERQPAYLMHCRAIIQQVLAMTIAASQTRLPPVPHAHRIASIMQMLQRNERDHFTVEELAGMARLSASRFRLLFQQVAGQSVIRYQNTLRVNRAKDLLLSGNCTVTEAAELLGFRDVYYFSRMFKRMTGQNPSSYRRH